MQHDDFIGLVQNRARLSSRGEAERVARATLETLGERLAGGLGKNVASQLPPELGHYLTIGPGAQRLSLDDFFERVKGREGEHVDLPAAVHHARAVISVLEEAVSPGEIRKVRDQLPEEYDPLFESGPWGRFGRGGEPPASETPVRPGD